MPARIVTIEQRPLAMTIGDWEEENNAIWPPYEGDDEKTVQEKECVRGWAVACSGLDDCDYKAANMIGSVLFHASTKTSELIL